MQESKEQQQFFMKWAIALGEKGRITAPPNPWVGCVIVKEGEIIAEGYHVRPGEAHAEKKALENAGSTAQGATLYVTLEPCCHENKRTPPCTEAILKAGIKCVHVALLDPDPHVNGKGIERLRQKGVEVTVGLCEEEANSSLAPYLFQRKHKRPYTLLKAAVSLDGKIAAKDGSSKWLTGESARADAHRLRAESGAILVGLGTALMDQPQLTVRNCSEAFDHQPLRVFLDPRGDLTGPLPFLDTSVAKTLIFTTQKCRPEILEEWKAKGVEIALQEGNDISLEAVMQELYRRQIVQLLVEGGASTHTHFFKKGFANKLVIYKAPCFLGNEGKPFLLLDSPPTVALAPRFHLESVQRFDKDVRLNFLVV